MLQLKRVQRMLFKIWLRASASDADTLHSKFLSIYLYIYIYIAAFILHPKHFDHTLRPITCVTFSSLLTLDMVTDGHGLKQRVKGSEKVLTMNSSAENISSQHRKGCKVTFVQHYCLLSSVQGLETSHLLVSEAQPAIAVTQAVSYHRPSV